MAERERPKLKKSSSPAIDTPSDTPASLPLTETTSNTQVSPLTHSAIPTVTSVSMEPSLVNPSLPKTEEIKPKAENSSELPPQPVEKISPPTPPPMSTLEEWLLRYFTVLGVKRDSDLFRYAIQIIENLVQNEYSGTLAQIETWIPAVVHWSVIFLHQIELLPKLMPLISPEITHPSWEMGQFLVTHEFHPEKIMLLNTATSREEILQTQFHENFDNHLFLRSAEDIYHLIKSPFAGIEPKLLAQAIEFIVNQLFGHISDQPIADPSIELILPLITSFLRMKNYTPIVLGSKSEILPMGAIAQRWQRYWAVCTPYLDMGINPHDVLMFFARVHSYREFNNYDPELLAYIGLQNLDSTLNLEESLSQYDSNSLTYLNDAIHHILGSKSRPIDAQMVFFMEVIEKFHTYTDNITQRDSLGLHVSPPWRAVKPISTMYAQITKEAESQLLQLNSQILNRTSNSVTIADLYITAARKLGYPICNDDVQGVWMEHESLLDSDDDQSITPVVLNHIIYLEGTRIFPPSISAGAFYVVHNMVRALGLANWVQKPTRAYIQSLCKIVHQAFQGKIVDKKTMNKLHFDSKDVIESTTLLRIAEKGIHVLFTRFQEHPEYMGAARNRMISIYLAALSHLPLQPYREQEFMITLIEKLVLTQVEILPLTELTPVEKSWNISRKTVDRIIFELNHIDLTNHPYLSMLGEGLQIYNEIEDHINIEFNVFWQMWQEVIRRIQPQTSHQMNTTVYLAIMTLMNPTQISIPLSVIEELVPHEYRDEFEYYWSYLTHDFPSFITESQKYSPTFEKITLKVNSK